MTHVVCLYRVMWWRSPTTHAHDFAIALTYQREQLTKGEKFAAACWSALNLVVLRREAALMGGSDADQAELTPLLAEALTEYGKCLMILHRHEEAVAVVLEAIHIWSNQPQCERDMRLADALCMHAECLVQLDRTEDARPPARRAVDILYTHYHAKYSDDNGNAVKQRVVRKLLPALLTCANLYPASDPHHASTLSQAADVARVELSKSLSPTTQQKQQLADILASLAGSLSSSGEDLSACTVMSELVAIQCALDASSEASIPWGARKHLYPYLRTYASYCTRAGLHNNAAEALREYRDVCRAVYNREWGAARQLLDTLVLYACALARAGRGVEARDALLDGARVCWKAWAVNPVASTKVLRELFERYAGEFEALGTDTAPGGLEDVIGKAVDETLEVLRRNMGEIDGSLRGRDSMGEGGYGGGCG